MHIGRIFTPAGLPIGMILRIGANPAIPRRIQKLAVGAFGIPQNDALIHQDGIIKAVHMLASRIKVFPTLYRINRAPAISQTFPGFLRQGQGIYFIGALQTIRLAKASSDA